MSITSQIDDPDADVPVLSEQTRREYLHAMGIVSWLPKDEPWLSIIESEKPPVTAIDESASVVSLSIENKTMQRTELSVEKTVNPTEIVDNDSYPAKAQFLRVVNWRNQSTQSDSVKTVLVICRHKIDEPASSFSRANSPSQFMLDYIAALLEISKCKGIDLNVQLAHLSQVGLTDDSVSFNEGLEKSKPDLVLILGDETLKQFVQDSDDVSLFRGKSIALNKTVSACTSYHPYTLIQEPTLKRLAFEDLVQLVDCLNA